MASCNVLLDTGSSLALTRRSLADYLDLPGKPTTLDLSVAGGQSLGQTKERFVHFRLMNLQKTFASNVIVGVTCKCPGEPYPPTRLDPKNYDYLSGFDFSYSYPQSRPVPIDLILTSSIVYEMQDGEITQSPFEIGPRAAHYRLGTALCGSYIEEVSYSSSSLVSSSSPCYFVGNAVESPFVQQVKDFFRLEQLGFHDDVDSELTVAEAAAVDMFRSSISYDPVAREYTVPMLWKENPADWLDDNIACCLAICKSVKNKTLNPPELAERVNAAFWEQYNLGRAEVVPHNSWRVPAACFCLPARPIFKDTSASTPIRVVLDGSAKCRSTGKSLNDLLHIGPNLLPDICQLMLGFRQSRFVFVLDLSKMFWRIRISDKDQPFLRYVWQFDVGQDPVMFQSIAMLFGATDSPFKALATVRHHAEAFQDTFPRGAKAVLQTLYLDDIKGRGNVRQEVVLTAKEVFELFSLASFPTHKWASNDPSILSEAGIPPELRSPSTRQKYLGLAWETETDTLEFRCCDVIKASNDCITKRSMLSELSSIYDVLGLLSPFTMKGKVLFQKIWSYPEIDWDDAAPPELAKPWQQWRDEAAENIVFSIPRLVADPDEKKWLACFSDGSDVGFGVVLMVVGETSSRLLFSKAKVAPTKLSEKEKNCPPMTTARLEMMGAVLAARCAFFVRKAFPENYFTHTRFFVDSLITFFRIQNEPNNYRVWLANRIKEIQQKAGKENFRFVPGEMNVSDACSRGISSLELSKNLLWWNGPPFLLKPEKDWPVKKALSHAEALKELSGDLKVAESAETNVPLLPAAEMTARVFCVTSKWQTTWSNRLLKYYPSWKQLIRATAFIFRLLLFLLRKNASLQAKLARLLATLGRAIRSPVFDSSSSAATQRESSINEELSSFKYDQQFLSTSNLNAAESFWIKIIQRSSFPQAFADPDNLVSYHNLHKYSALLCDQNILHAKSRFSLSVDMPTCTIFPTILPRKNRAVELLVLQIHHADGHLPKNQTFYKLRSKFLLAGGRHECNRILARCDSKICNPPKLLQAPVGALPKERIDAIGQHEAWQVMMLDYAGPFQVAVRCEHDGEQFEDMRKCYILLATCLKSRAIALELVADLSTESFMAAFERITNRTALPKFVFSDNALTFKSADRYLTKLFKAINWNKCASESAHKGIEWRFGIDKSPSSQGAIERLVFATKKGFYSNLQNRRLSTLEFQTLLSSCERWMNDRPLCMEADNLNSELPITPNRLIKNCDSSTLPYDLTPLVDVDPKDRVTRMMVARRELHKKLWKTWKDTYLLQFQATRLSASKHMPKLEVGQFVLLREKNLKTGIWKLCRILELIPSKDGVIRRVKLKVGDKTPSVDTIKTSIIFRHVHDIALLELDVPSVVVDDQQNVVLDPNGQKTPAGPLTRRRSRELREKQQASMAASGVLPPPSFGL